MNILVLTNIIPAPVLTFNARENDVLIKTAELHERMYPDVKHTFVFVLYTSFFTRFMGHYREHKEFQALKSFSCQGRNIGIISVPTFKWHDKLWPLYMRYAFFRNRKKLTRIIRDNKIDVTHAHNIIGDLGITDQLAQRFKIPFVVTVRNVGRAERILKYVWESAARASAVISLGSFEKALADGITKRSYLIPHGINERFLSLKKEYSNDRTLKIVTVSRLLYWKNIDKVLFALEQIGDGFTFDIYGDGPFSDVLMDIVNRSSIRDKITFHGFIPYDAVPETLARYDLFVLPSFREIFGRVYIEAMSCGLPIIAARNTGMDGHITEGEQGFLVDHTNVDDLRYAIQKFIDDPDLKISMGRKAKEFSMKFSWDAVVGKLDGIYRSAVSQPN